MYLSSNVLYYHTITIKLTSLYYNADDCNCCILTVRMSESKEIPIFSADLSTFEIDWDTKITELTSIQHTRTKRREHIEQARLKVLDDSKSKTVADTSFAKYPLRINQPLLQIFHKDAQATFSEKDHSLVQNLALLLSRCKSLKEAGGYIDLFEKKFPDIAARGLCIQALIRSTVQPV